MCLYTMVVCISSHSVFTCVQTPCPDGRGDTACTPEREAHRDRAGRRRVSLSHRARASPPCRPPRSIPPVSLVIAPSPRGFAPSLREHSAVLQRPAARRTAEEGGRLYVRELLPGFLVSCQRADPVAVRPDAQAAQHAAPVPPHVAPFLPGHVQTPVQQDAGVWLSGHVQAGRYPGHGEQSHSDLVADIGLAGSLPGSLAGSFCRSRYSVEPLAGWSRIRSPVPVSRRNLLRVWTRCPGERRFLWSSSRFLPFFQPCLSSLCT